MKNGKFFNLRVDFILGEEIIFRRTFIFFCLCFFIGCTSTKNAAISKYQTSLADNYFKNKEYSKSIRLLSPYCAKFGFGGNSIIDTVATKILADSYFESRKYINAIHYYNLLLSSLQDENNIDYVKNRVSNIYISLGNYTTAKELLSSTHTFEKRSLFLPSTDSSFT